MRRNSITVQDIGAGQWHIVNGAGQSMYLRQDMGIVPVAETFGMRLRHKRGCADRSGTDGTVSCDTCGQSADTFYGQAHDYLSGVIAFGRTVTDPGYFQEGE